MPRRVGQDERRAEQAGHTQNGGTPLGSGNTSPTTTFSAVTASPGRAQSQQVTRGGSDARRDTTRMHSVFETWPVSLAVDVDALWAMGIGSLPPIGRGCPCGQQR